MSEPPSILDVMHNPSCFIEAPEEGFGQEFEAKWGIAIREFDLWEIEDADLPTFPDHIAIAIRRLRDPNNPEERWPGGGSMFFLDGEPLKLSPALKWPQVEQILGSESQEGN